MAKIATIVYDPPAPGFPHIAVLFDTNGEVMAARAVPSREAGEAFIAGIMTDLGVPQR